MPEAFWHARRAEQVLESLSLDPQRGLSSEEVQQRLLKYGYNELKKEEKISPLSLFFNQFKNLLIIILLIATALSVLVGEVLDAVMIAAIVVLSAVLGFIQEYKAEQALEALKKMLSPTITVLRDGKEEDIPSRSLVPGDILLLEAGDKMPAVETLSRATVICSDKTGTLTKGEMITGDHEITARAVAKEIGIYQEGDMVLSGEKLAKMPQEEVVKALLRKRLARANSIGVASS